MIGLGFHLVIVCLLVTSSHQTEFDQLIRSVSNNCGNLLQAYSSSLFDCQGFRSIQSKLTQPFCTSGDINKLEEVLCGTGISLPSSGTNTGGVTSDSSLPSSGTNTGGVTSSGVPVHHSSPASAVVKETPDVTSPTDTTADVGSTAPINETELQKTFRELGDELTSPTCKAVLKDRDQVWTSFSEACCVLISFQTTLVPGLCTQLEYEKAHDVLCVNVTCPTTAPPEHVTHASQMSTEHKEKVLCIIDTQLSTDSCRATARQLAEGESEQGHACQTLKSFQSALDAIGCSRQDYDTLYSVICDDVDTTCVREDQLIKSVSNNCGNLLQAYRANVSDCQGFRSIRSKLTQPFCTSGDINKLEELLCGTGSSLPGSGTNTGGVTSDSSLPNSGTNTGGVTSYSSLPSSGTNTGGVTSAGVPVQHTKQASAVVKETPDVTSPTDSTADAGTTVPINETELQKTFRELEDEITSPTCKMVLKDRANVLTSFSEACCMLISFQTTLVPGLCTQLEYDRAHDVMCVNVTCQGNGPTDHVTDSSDNLTTDKCAKTTSTDVTGTTTSTDVTDNTTSKDIAGTTTSIDTTSKTTLTTTPVATTPTSTTSPDPASSTTAPPRANIFPLKLRLLFSVVTHDDVKEQLEVLVN